MVLIMSRWKSKPRIMKLKYERVFKSIKSIDACSMLWLKFLRVDFLNAGQHDVINISRNSLLGGPENASFAGDII